jgi:uncharacterized RDD family membrane protein YckC
MNKPLPLLLTTLALAAALAGLSAAVPVAAATTTPPANAAVAAPAAPTTPAAPKDADNSHSLTIKVTAGADDAADKAAAAADDAANDTAGGGKGRDDALVSIGHDSTLESGKHASAVVSVFGSSTSAGEVDDAVVSVVGNTRVTGPVGDSAVAVLGSTYVDSTVGDSVVAVLGNVELGPHAVVHGDVVAVGGDLVRDPGAIVEGSAQNVAIFGHMGDLQWLHNWVHNCLMYGRPLAFAPGLGWAWTMAFSFLALYLLMALLFPGGISRCVQTMEAQPGRTTLAALFTFIGKPIVFLVLVVTVIGTILVPFLAFALMVAGLFGKAVAFAWLGGRALPRRAADQQFPPVLAVLVGGLIALLLYVVPVLGFIAYKGLDVLGLGMVVYTLILALRARREAAQAAAATAGTAAAAAATADAQAGTSPEQGGTASAPSAPAAAAGAPPAAPALSLDLDNRAGFWIRMVALLLDLILVGIVCSILQIPTHDGLLLVLAAYGAVMWKLRGTTIGGIVCGLRLVRLDGRPIDWATAVTRALASFLSFFVVGLGFIWVVFDPERQSWHDKIAGTVVVHAPRGTPLV